MIQTITICDKEYPMKANLHVHEVYKNLYGVELSQAIMNLNEKIKHLNDSEKEMGAIGEVVNECLKIAWIMIKELNDNFMSLEDWEKELDDGLVGSWLSEVLTLAFSPFRNRKVPQDHKQPNK